MNPEKDSDNLPEACGGLVEALLEEHARLGTADDEGLLATIRARTTENTLNMEQVTVSPRQRDFGVRDWMKVAATVTVALGLIWMLLQLGSFGPVFQKEDHRPEFTMRLIVIPDTEEAVAGNPGKSSKLPIFPIPDYAELAAMELENGETEGSMSFAGLEVVDLEVSDNLLAEFSITADRKGQGDGDHQIVYEGDVVLKHPDFTLRADRLELAAGAGEARLVGGFLASGDVVEIDRTSAAGAVENARARRVKYAAEGGSLILRGGPPSLSSGSSFVVPKSAAGVIVLHQDGFRVIEPVEKKR